jgi:hypothetical protein
MQSIFRIFLPLFVLVYALIGFRAWQITFDNAGDARSQIRGDSFTESLSWNGVRYFFDHGFWPTKFMPNYGYVGAIAEKKQKEFDKSWIYKHYPSLPDVITGITAVAMRTIDVRVLRIFPIVISVLLLWLMWRALILLLPKKEAMVSFGILVLSNYFVAWADNIHKFLYEEIIKWAILFVFLRRFIIRKHREDIALLAILYFLCACISFDAIVVSAVICIGVSLIYRKKLLTVETVVPGVATVAALALHGVQNILFFGSFQAALDDLLSIFQTRTVGTIGSESGKLTLPMWLQHFFYWNINRVERFFLLPGWAVLFFAVLFYRKWRSENRETFKFIPLFLFAAVSWNCVMWQHAYVHVWTARNWSFIVGLLGGPALLFLWNNIRIFSEKPLLQKIGLVVLTIYIIGMAITQHFWDLYLRHGFLFSFFIRE